MGEFVTGKDVAPVIPYSNVLLDVYNGNLTSPEICQLMCLCFLFGHLLVKYDLCSNNIRLYSQYSIVAYYSLVFP